MSKKRKISIRRVLQALITLVVVTGSVLAILSASEIQDNKKLSGIDIQIKNKRFGFVDETEVKNLLLNSRHIDIATTSIKKLDIRQMEAIINANPWIANAQLYIDNKRVLHVNVRQRVPVARLFERNGNSYYLDHTLKAMPLSDRYVHYTTVVTNVPVLKDDSFGNALRAQIVALVQHVEKDTFWNAQVSQIIVSDDTTGFELVPVLGEHRILFGDTTLMQQKFDHLFAFYRKVLNRIGWNKYQVLDLRFNGQIVASPALPWKKPKDNTMGNINWVNSIISAEPKETAQPDTPMRVTMHTALAKAAPEYKEPANAVKATAPVQAHPEEATAKQEITVAKAKTKPGVKDNLPKAPVQNVLKAAPGKTTKKPAVKTTDKEVPTKNTQEERTPKYIYQGK